jgi:hypothetical protein
MNLQPQHYTFIIKLFVAVYLFQLDFSTLATGYVSLALSPCLYSEARHLGEQARGSVQLQY